MAKVISKESLIASSITFTTTDVDASERLDPDPSHNFVDIVSLDGSGVPVVPASGSYSVFVKTSENNGFQSISDNGTIEADKTGGDAAADGVNLSASFGSNAIAVKVTPLTIVGAVSYRVTVRQNLT